MAGLPESDYLDFARRTRARYPELEVVSEPRVLFNIDKMRRTEGRQPTRIGDAVRSVMPRQQTPQQGLFNDARTRFRIGESTPAQPQQFDVRSLLERGGINRTEDARAQSIYDFESVQAEPRIPWTQQGNELRKIQEMNDPRQEAWRGTGNEATDRVLDRPYVPGPEDALDVATGGRTLRSLILNPSDPVGAVKESLAPSKTGGDFQLRNAGGIRSLSDTDVVGPLSLRDIVGGVADIGADPGTVFAAAKVAPSVGRAVAGGVKSLGDEAAAAALRQVDEPIEASNRGALRPVRGGSPGAVVPTGPGTPGGRAMLAGGAPNAPMPPPVIPATPASQLEILFNVKPPEVGLSRARRIQNQARALFGSALDDEVATPIMEMRKAAQPAIENQANRLGNLVEATVNRAFKVGKDGRISDLPGNPTIQTVAARLPGYRQYLTPQQIDAMDLIRHEFEPYKPLVTQQGIEVGTRADIMDGGFYLPRGNAAPVNFKAAPGGRGGRGRAGYRKTAAFDSMEEGIDAGYRYENLVTAVGNHVRDTGREALDAHAAALFKAAADDVGNLVGLGPRARLLNQNPGIAARIEGLRKSLNSLRQTGARLTERQEIAIERFLHAPDGADLDALAQALDVRVGANAVGKRGVNYGKAPAQVRAAIRQIQADIKAVMPEWQKALEQARATPLGSGGIDLPGLQGVSFPDEIANAARRYLDAERAAVGRGTAAIKVTQATNSLLRMLTSTLDASGLGLQGLLGAALDPRAYGTALKHSVRGWWNPDSLGAYFKAFDEKAAKVGRPTSREWAAAGQRIGSSNTEFTGAGITGVARNLVEGDIPGTGRIPGVKTGLNPLRGTNRQFGFFGDVLRNELNDTAYEITAKAGKDARGAMESIAQDGNRMTGWSRSRVGGELGDLAIYAPRYFQANIETVVDGVRGLAPGASVGRQQARNALVRLIGLGTLVTVGANEARGMETDFRPVVDGRRNPNFLRIRDLAGQDISVFGTYDRLAGLVAMGASGDYADAARSVLNSPTVSLAWDLIAGENAVGERTRDTPQQFVERMIESTTPFSSREYVGGAAEIAGGDVSGGVAGLAVGATGLRGSPLSRSERVQKGEYYDMEPTEQFAAIPAQSWKAVLEGVPEELRADMGRFTNVRDWEQATVDAWTQAYIEQGHPAADSLKEAERQFQRSKAYRYYLDVKDHFETEWYATHPEEGRRYFEEQMAKPDYERKNMPTIEQRAVMDAALAAQ